MIKDIVAKHKNIKIIYRKLIGAGIADQIPNTHDNFSQNLYDLLYPQKIKSCSKGNYVRFISFSVGYRYCGPSGKCECTKASVSKNVKLAKSIYDDKKRQAINQKRIDTNMKKYGQANQFSRPEIQNQVLNFWNSAHPEQIENIVRKRKKTCQNRYGVDNPSQSMEIQEKIKQTNMDVYGVDSPLKNKNIQRKIQETNLNRYGVDNPAKSSVIRQKIQETNLNRYGVDNPAKSHQVRKRIQNNIRNAFYDRIKLTYGEYYIPEFTREEYINGIDDRWKCIRCGEAIHRKMINGVLPRCPGCMPINKSENEWLDSFENDAIIRQYRIWFEDGNYVIADGYDPETNTVYEYWGDYWHGNPKYYDPLDMNPNNGLTFGELYDHTLYKISQYHKHGYNLNEIWHSEFIVTKVKY